MRTLRTTLMTRLRTAFGTLEDDDGDVPGWVLITLVNEF